MPIEELREEARAQTKWEAAISLGGVTGDRPLRKPC